MVKVTEGVRSSLVSAGGPVPSICIGHCVEEEDGGAECCQRAERNACRGFLRQDLERRNHSAYRERQRQDNGCPHRYEARSLTVLDLWTVLGVQRASWLGGYLCSSS